jgi:hypothetical protein
MFLGSVLLAQIRFRFFCRAIEEPKVVKLSKRTWVASLVLVLLGVWVTPSSLELFKTLGLIGYSIPHHVQGVY